MVKKKKEEVAFFAQRAKLDRSLEKEPNFHDSKANKSYHEGPDERYGNPPTLKKWSFCAYHTFNSCGRKNILL